MRKEKLRKDRLNQFCRWMEQNRMFKSEEMVTIPLVESVLMYFAGNFCENSDRKYCKESLRSICRVTSNSHNNWKHDEISYFVELDENGHWQLSDTVKERLEERITERLEDNKTAPKAKVKPEPKPKSSKAIFINYNHSSLIEWYKEFCSKNNFSPNSGDIQVMENIKCESNESFVSEYNESSKDNRYPWYSSTIRTHSKQAATPSPSTVGKSVPSSTQSLSEAQLDRVVKLCENNNLEKIYCALTNKTDKRLAYTDFINSINNYACHKREMAIVCTNLKSVIKSGKIKTKEDLVKMFFYIVNLGVKALKDTQKNIEKNELRFNPPPVDQNEDLTNGKGL